MGYIRGTAAGGALRDETVGHWLCVRCHGICQPRRHCADVHVGRQHNRKAHRPRLQYGARVIDISQ
jgi:hypothetical protein